jgi:hypothetical protein
MTKPSTLVRGLALALALVAGAALAPAARAEGCYSCGDGSKAHCRDYCRYHGRDTYAARRECENKGCRVSGPTDCPQPGQNKAICLVPASAITTYESHLVASVPWYAPPAHGEDSRR